MIVELQHSFFSPVLSGQERRMHALGREFLRRGFRVAVCTSIEGVDAPRSYESQGIRIIVHPTFFAHGWIEQLLDPVLYSRRLERFMVARPPADVPDFVLAFNCLYAAAAKLAWPRVPVAYLSGAAIWDWYSQLCASRQGVVRAAFVLKQALGTLVERRAIGGADKTFVDAKALKNRLKRFHFGVDSNIDVLPTPVDLTRFEPSLEHRQQFRSEMGIPEDVTVILGVGRLQRNKNFGHLIRAVALLQSQNWLLLIVGQGEQRCELEELARALHVNNRVRFLGNRADMESVYAGADMFSHPALVESYGIAVLEAMACGLPCIVSSGDHIGISSQLSDGVTALLANPKDPADWSDKITSLLGDPGLSKRLGTEARSFCERLGSWPTFADVLLRGLGISNDEQKNVP